MTQPAGEYRTVGIIGGGTAGYLTALALRKKLPHLRVTLIESPTIPIIGVGEGTTPIMVKFLHAYLERDVHELYRKVQPTWKFGVKFEWGQPGDSYFNYAFHPGPILDSVYYGGDFNEYSLGSALISSERSPIVAGEGGRLTSLIDRIPFAYHLDNGRFVAYLREEAVRDGVERLARSVDAFVPTEDGESLDHIVTDDGEERRFDLYVDCTGFRAEIIGEALGSPFHSYEGSLFCDRAIVANVPHGGHVKPFTTAETMDAGWCWNTPSVEDDHRGYVFSSRFLGDDEAAEEMRAKNPGMGDHRVIRFTTGRREHFWKGNVVAIGNSYGFVEPLESTGLHMIILEINQLVLNFPRSKKDTAIRGIVNRTLNAHWDDVRWFLAVHYRFNRKLDTPFWRACREAVDIGGAQERVDLFRERTPLTYRQSQFFKPEEVFGDFAYDVLLLGQRVPGRYLEASQPRVEWQKRVEGLRQLAGNALPQERAFEALQGAPPEVLGSLVASPNTWVVWP